MRKAATWLAATAFEQKPGAARSGQHHMQNPGRSAGITCTDQVFFYEYTGYPLLFQMPRAQWADNACTNNQH
jgi:hypothetical protein